MSKLYLVATPIGNLSDMSERAVETLRNVDLIAAEDTRNSIKLLNHFGIKTPLTSYHEYNRIEKARELIGVMLSENKDIALISDAGMPAISDPGEDFVKLCYEAGIEVTVIPGPCAAVSALAISGLGTRRFCFEGFLPTEKKEREAILEELKEETRTIIIYEAPHRLEKTLELLGEKLGPMRNISVVRELTKVHEEVKRGKLGKGPEFPDLTVKGEFVIIIEGISMKEKKQKEQAGWNEMSIPRHVRYYEEQGMDRKEAMKKTAADRGIGKRDVYKECLEENEQT